ncbi:MAG: AI-2E family transporter, partial [Candidatus Dormibacteraeota bacterium]|nr:AI-2E family transporter [Candidatus Dormibacteraeota bacterium]
VALLVQPLVDLFESRVRLPRTAAVLAGLLTGVGLLALLGVLLAGPLVAEGRSLSVAVPGLIRRANGALGGLRAFAEAHGVSLGTGSLSGGSGKRLTASLGVLLTGVTGTVQVAIDVLITLVVAFWLLRDGTALREGALSILPSRISSEVEFGLDAGRAVVGGYVRAQVALAALVGSLAGIGCALLGVPFPLVVALAAGIFELIPLVGAIIGGLVAVLLALTVSPGLALATVGLFVAIHIVEGYGIAPRVQARFVRLHPLLALLALLTGVEVGGFLGALFAVPIASLGAVFLRAAIGDWRAQRPEVFAPQRRDRYLEGRRRRLLREFRLFRRPS